MENLDTLITQYYEKFKGLPNDKPIIRLNQENDAFEIVVLETLYGAEKSIDISKISANDVENLAKYIVPPPDSGIDIVVEHENIDGSTYDFIQVKNAALGQLDIRMALTYMERSISDFLENPTRVHQHLRDVLSNTDLSRSDKSNCKYIVVHRGNNNFIKDQKNNELIITGKELESIRDGRKSEIPRVPTETFLADCFNNFITYEESAGNPAILLNLRGMELAELALRYTNTSLGRNILFGYNLRESLSTNKSKTYEGMAKTIKEEPAKFWFYNNGITIITEDYNIFSKDKGGGIEKIVLKNFSIINGAQTTSALGNFLKNAEMDCSVTDKKQLEKVFVLARILKVTDDEFKSQIAIYNNTQNPITTRDMVSNREEQLRLYNGLLEGIAPNIYMEIRRGMKVPNNVKLYKHQYTTNTELAQLAYAGFRLDPFTAKDKKGTIFDTDYKQQDYLLNKYYHTLFNHDANKRPIGELFHRQKDEIDELLFVYYLYKLSKKELIRKKKDVISTFNNELATTDDDAKKKRIQDKIVLNEKIKAISNICVFYCVAYYYSFKENFSTLNGALLYKYEDFYSSKDLQKQLVKDFTDLFLMGTVKLIIKLTVNVPNLNTWIRDKRSADTFMNEIGQMMQTDVNLENYYTAYVNTYKR